MHLEGAVALITGASSGIGAAIARAFAARGARLAVVGRDSSRLDKVASEAKDGLVLQGDLTDISVAAELISRVVERFGRCDILVNNAGALERGGIDAIDLDATVRMIRLNVEAAICLGTCALRLMKSQGQGWVVNMSSVAGIKDMYPEVAVYTATKHALEAWSEGVRPELAGTGVGITCIEPGLVRTGLYDHWRPEDQADMAARPALTAEDVADAVLFVVGRPPHVRIPKLFILPDGEKH